MRPLPVDLVLLTIALLVASSRPAYSTHVAVKATLWQPTCELVGDLRKTNQQAHAKIKRQLTNLETLNKVRIKLLLFATKQGHKDEARVARAIAAAAAEELHLAITATSTLTDKAIKAIAYANDLSGAINSAIDFLKHATGSSNYCLTNEANNADGKNEAASKGCKELELNLDGSDVATGEDNINAQGFPKLNVVGTTEGKGTISQCGLFKASNGETSTTGIYIGDTNAKVHLAYGLIKGTQSNQPNRADVSKAGTDGTPHADDIFGKTAKAAWTLRQQATAELLTDNKELYKRLASKSAAVATLKIEEAAETGTGKLTTNSTHEINLKNKYFGADLKKVEELWDKVKQEKVVATKDDLTQQADIGDVTNPTLLQQALTYYQTLAAVELTKFKAALEKLEGQIKTDKAKTTTQICNKKLDAKTCNADKNCKYDENIKEGPKCVLSEEGEKSAEKEKAGKEEKKEEKCKGKEQKDYKDGCKLGWKRVQVFQYSRQ